MVPILERPKLSPRLKFGLLPSFLLCQQKWEAVGITWSWVLSSSPLSYYFRYFSVIFSMKSWQSQYQKRQNSAHRLKFGLSSPEASEVSSVTLVYIEFYYWNQNLPLIYFLNNNVVLLAVGIKVSRGCGHVILLEVVKWASIAWRLPSRFWPELKIDRTSSCFFSLLDKGADLSAYHDVV